MTTYSGRLFHLSYVLEVDPALGYGSGSGSRKVYHTLSLLEMRVASGDESNKLAAM